ncbi:MAG: metallophosphoesterase [Candidatus Absconditicoccaceae bacterium]
MLLIGDIHITQRFKDKIISGIQNFIDQNPDEKNIIFLGDYVYHFSYDRNSILELYNLFLELFENGKNVYILAGNHDRLGNSFVYQEAMKAFQIINNLHKQNDGKLTFITEPTIQDIEGQKILFFPFMLDSNQIKYTNPLFQELAKSSNKNEQISGYINQILENFIEQNENLTIIHHYYINNTVFPGQRSRFNYKDIALNEDFLKNSKIRLISGHLHQGFIKNNYLCTGSIWSTNSLEINQNKFLFKYNTPNNEITANFININPYILIESEEKVDKSILNYKIDKIIQENKDNFEKNDLRNIKFKNNNTQNLENLSLSIKVKDIDYEKMEDYIDSSLMTEIKDIKLKKNLQSVGELLKDFSVSTENLKIGFTDWKTILQEYIKNKFGPDYPHYEKILKDLKLI